MRTLQTAVVAFVWGLVGPIAVPAEIISVPPAASSSPADSLPPPTILRGSPPSVPKPAPICPPGYAPSPDYGCVAQMGSDYGEYWPGDAYWPGYGFGYPGFGYRAGRFPRFHGFRSFHGPARFGRFSIGVGHTGGFGRR